MLVITYFTHHWHKLTLFDPTVKIDKIWIKTCKVKLSPSNCKSNMRASNFSV